MSTSGRSTGCSSIRAGAAGTPLLGDPGDRDERGRGLAVRRGRARDHLTGASSSAVASSSAGAWARSQTRSPM